MEGSPLFARDQFCPTSISSTFALFVSLLSNVTSQTCEEEEEQEEEEEEEEDPGELGRGTQDVFRDSSEMPQEAAMGWRLTLVTYHYFVCSHLFTPVLLIRLSPRRPPADADGCARGGT